MVVIVNNPGGGEGNATYDITSTTTTQYDYTTSADLGNTTLTAESSTSAKMECITTNMTQARALMEKLLSKNCGATSIPMGIGSGVFVFVAIVILVAYLMKREDKKNEMFIEVPENTGATPIPFDCESLIHAPPLQSIEEYPEVFADNAAASTCSTTHTSSQKSEQKKKTPPSMNVLCSKELINT